MTARERSALLAVATLAFAATGATAREMPDEKAAQAATQAETRPSEKTPRTIDGRELAKNADQYYGQRVTVKAEVDDVLNAHGFTLDSDRPLSGPEILVIVNNPDPAQRLADDDEVTVTGTVRRFVRGELEREFDWFGATAPKWEAEFSEKPVIIADSVQTARGRRTSGAGDTPTAATTTGTSAGGTATTTSAGELAKNPANYYGQKVTVSAEVEDVFGATAFTLDEDELFAGPDVLVIVPNTRQAVPENRKVTVTGTVRQYVAADLDRDYDWFSPRVEWETQFRARPVIVADSVKTDDGRELIERSAGTQPQKK